MDIKTCKFIPSSELLDLDNTGTLQRELGEDCSTLTWGSNNHSMVSQEDFLDALATAYDNWKDADIFDGGGVDIHACVSVPKAFANIVSHIHRLDSDILIDMES